MSKWTLFCGVLLLLSWVGPSLQETYFTYNYYNDTTIPYSEGVFYQPPNATDYILVTGGVIGTQPTQDDASINFIVMTLQNFYKLSQGQAFQVIHSNLLSKSFFYEEDNILKYQNEGGIVLWLQNLDLILKRSSRVEYHATVSLLVPTWISLCILAGLVCCCCGCVVTCAVCCGTIGLIVRSATRKSTAAYSPLGGTSVMTTTGTTSSTALVVPNTYSNNTTNAYYYATYQPQQQQQQQTFVQSKQTYQSYGYY